MDKKEFLCSKMIAKGMLSKTNRQFRDREYFAKEEE